MKFLHLVWGNLKRKKVRTVLTVLSILVAFLLFGYLTAIRQAFAQGVDVAGADRLVVRHKVSIIQMLPESYGDRMEQMEGVELVALASWFGGIYQKPSNFFAQMPVEPEPFLEMYPEFILDEEEKEAWLATRTASRSAARPPSPRTRTTGRSSTRSSSASPARWGAVCGGRGSEGAPSP